MMSFEKQNYLNQSWASGGENINGNSARQTLSIESRENDIPDEYKASQWIEFVDEFESGSGDEFVAYIADYTNSLAGNMPKMPKGYTLIKDL